MHPVRRSEAARSLFRFNAIQSQQRWPQISLQGVRSTEMHQPWVSALSNVPPAASEDKDTMHAAFGASEPEAAPTDER